MRQLLSCINYLHSVGIVHCDLKPENILLEDNRELQQLKIIDFGFAQEINKADNQRLSKTWGTPHYSAPEVFEGDYCEKVDLWSAGVICYLLLSDEFPFWGETREELIQVIKQGNLSFTTSTWDNVSDSAKDFISKLLTVEEDKRLSADEALSHPWIQQSTQQMWSEMKPCDFSIIVTALNNLLQYSPKNELQRAAFALIASQFLPK